jgi:hypothetical protein
LIANYLTSEFEITIFKQQRRVKLFQYDDMFIAVIKIYDMAACGHG